MTNNSLPEQPQDHPNKLKSLVDGISSQVMSNLYVWAAGALIALLVLSFNKANQFINEITSQKIREQIIQILREEEADIDAKKIWSAINQHVENTLKSKAGNINIGGIVFDSASVVEEIKVLSDPAEKTLLLLNINGLLPGDKILMTDGTTGYTEKISKNGPRNFDMTAFFKRSELFAKDNSVVEPPEAPVSSKDFFSNFHRISFALKQNQVDQLDIQASTASKNVQKNKIDKPDKVPVQVDLSYILIAYPPLSISKLQESMEVSNDHTIK